MRQYLNALRFVLENGEDRKDRTGVGIRSVFGYQMRFDLTQGFPAVTTKKLAWKSVVSELLWFIEGSADERRLAEIRFGKDRSEIVDKKTIWTANADADYWAPKAQYPGDLGRVYGVQWRKWRKPKLDNEVWVVEEIDQLKRLIENLKNNPYDRRHIITAWNPGELDEMALPPCHCFAQFYVSNMSYNERLNWAVQHLSEKEIEKLEEENFNSNDLDYFGVPTKKLSCQLYQRSVDAALGLPFNISSYSLFTHMIAQVCGYGVDEFVHTSGDLHIYTNHFEGIREQLNREPLELPNLWLNPEIMNIDEFTMDDIKLIDYKSHDAIKMEMAV